jgi:hypothetical protein
MHALLSRWMSRSPSLFGGTGRALAVALPHAVARRDGGRVSRLAPAPRRLDDGGAGPLPMPCPMTGSLAFADAPHDPVRLQVDPSDQRRTRISGRMGDVCAALDALIGLQQA